MPTLLDPSIELLASLDDDDLFYVVRGTGADRDKKTDAQGITAHTAASNNEFSGVNNFTHSPGFTLGTIGSVSSGAIPLYTLDASTPRYLRNLDYVYLGTLGMGAMNPREWDIISDVASAHITVEDYTVPCFTITVAGVMTPHLVGSGTFSVTAPFVRVLWNGMALFFITVVA